MLHVLVLACLAALSVAQPSPTSPFIPPQGSDWWIGMGGDSYRTRSHNNPIGTLLATPRWYSSNLTASASVVFQGTVWVLTTGLSTGGQDYLNGYDQTSGVLITSTLIPLCGNSIAVDPVTQYIFILANYITAFNTNTMKIQWTSDDIELGPSVGAVIVNGQVFVASYNSDSQYMHLTAYNAATGAVTSSKRLFQTFGGTVGGPTLSWNSQQVLFSSTAGLDGLPQIGGLSLSSPSMLWSYTLSPASLRGNCVNEFTPWSPVSSNGVHLALRFNTHCTSATLVALSVSGTLPTKLWETDSFLVNATLERGTNAPPLQIAPATDGRRVFIITSNPLGDQRYYSAILEFSLRTGACVARYVCWDCFGSPVITSDYVFAMGVYSVYVFHRGNTTVNTKIPVQGPLVDMAYHGGWLYITTGVGIMGVQLLTKA